MGETLLKKEFTKTDVSRLRNLFSGKVGDATRVQVGYGKKKEEHKEGDIWKEDNKEWTIKGGIKQTYTKLDGIKKMLATPMICPSCGGRMKDKLDKKMYSIHGKCLVCVQSFETKLKLEGKYEQYAQDIMYANARTFAEQAREYLSEMEKSEHHVYTEAGTEEDWSGPNANHKMIERMRGELDLLEERVKEE